MSEDLRWGFPSIGVVGVEPVLRGVGRAVPYRIELRRSSNLDNALGLLRDFGTPCSATLSRRGAGRPLYDFGTVGVAGPSC